MRKERSDIRSQKLWSWQVCVGGWCSFPRTGRDQDMCAIHRSSLLRMNLLVGCGFSIDVHRLYTASQVPETVQEVVFCLSPRDPDEAMNPVSAERL